MVLAGYSFSHAREVLEPFHRRMLHQGVEATFFVNIEQASFRREPPERHAHEQVAALRTETWPFGPPSPREFYDRRALVPGPPWYSLHAKCVSADDARAFISSANFTLRGQERNFETGVVIEDRGFARKLAAQWLGLIQAGLVQEVKV